jgi:flagellar basal body rod protein FlgG
MGTGFFVLLDKKENKIYLTRNGSFKYDDNGFLVNQDGMYVLNLESELIYKNIVFIKRDDFNKFKEKDFDELSIRSITGDPVLERIYPFLILHPQNIDFVEIISVCP